MYIFTSIYFWYLKAVEKFAKYIPLKHKLWSCYLSASDDIGHLRKVAIIDCFWFKATPELRPF